jgi:RNA polymerase sigma factor (sigma-70 family)
MEYPHSEQPQPPQVAPQEAEEALSLTRYQVNLALGCTGMVRDIAWNMAKNNPLIEVEDAISDGNFGLIRAASNYAPGVSTKFSSYAYHRIRGEILSGLRRRTADEYPNGRPPLSLQESVAGEEDDITLQDVLADMATTQPEAVIPLVDMSRAINNLTGVQRNTFLLSLQGLNGLEIARELGISGPAVGQALRRAIIKIRQDADLPTPKKE